MNNADDAGAYHRVLREHAETLEGNAPAPQRANRDHATDAATGKRISSLR